MIDHIITIITEAQEMTDKEKQRIISNAVFILKAKLDVHGVKLKVSVKELSKLIMECVK